jgi:hypothetical protein
MGRGSKQRSTLDVHGSPFTRSSHPKSLGRRLHGERSGYASDVAIEVAPATQVEVETTFRDTPLGRMRSPAVGVARGEVPELVLVQGMAVADYLLPGLAALGSCTWAHLVEIPGYEGRGDPPHDLDVPEQAQPVASWLDAASLGRVVLAGHSSGTQVAARAEESPTSRSGSAPACAALPTPSGFTAETASRRSCHAWLRRS